MPFNVDPRQQQAPPAPDNTPIVPPPTNPDAPSMGPYPPGSLAGLSPAYQNMVTNGPDGQQWGGRQMVDRATAERMGQMLGGDVVELNYGGGPYSTNVPQYQLDFGTGNLHDATLLYEQYLRAPSPQQFQNQMRDELASDQRPPVAVQEMLDRRGGAGGGGALPPGGGGGGALPPGGGGGQGTTPPPPNLPGPTWQPPAVLPPPTGPQTTPYTGPPVRTGGTFTVPPMYSWNFPAPVDLTPEGTGLPGFVRPPRGLLNVPPSSPTGSPTAGLLNYLRGGSR